MKKKNLPVDDVIKYYLDGKKVKDISRIYNCHPTTIQRLLKKNSVLKPLRFNNVKYNVNEKYFDTIDSEEKAYWLGMMMTDGCVDKHGRTRLNLQTADEDHIRKFQKSIGSNHPIHRFSKGDHKISCLSIGNQYLAQSLRNKGIIANHKIMYPNLEENLKKHFWRGAIDGDGCICFSHHNKHVRLSLCGTEEICCEFKKFCQLYIKTKAKILKLKSKLFNFCINGYISMRICNLLYSDSCIFLNRKKEKYIYCAENYKGSQ